MILLNIKYINQDIIIKYASGLKILIGLVSVGLFLYQSILLLQNYNQRDTFRTIREMDIKGPMPSPLVIICQDPGSLNISDDSVRVTPYSHINFSFNKIVTAFKVLEMLMVRL